MTHPTYSLELVIAVSDQEHPRYQTTIVGKSYVLAPTTDGPFVQQPETRRRVRGKNNGFFTGYRGPGMGRVPGATVRNMAIQRIGTLRGNLPAQHLLP